MDQLAAGPGDVIAVWSGANPVDNMIRVGEALMGKPAVANHVVLVTHQDAKGRWMGIQGQPGGVGLADCTPMLNDTRTRINHAQPRDMKRMPFFLASAAKSMGIAYDWVGIAEDTFTAMHAVSLAAQIDHLYRWPTDHGLLPGHVVCSSLAAMLYDLPEVGWAHPGLGTERKCEPADWWDWSDRALWLKS